MTGVRGDTVRAAFARGGQTGALMADYDWASTPVGPIESWPQSLVSTVGMLLASKAQIVMFWGPEFIAFYNDTYAPTIGDKHPQALGRPAAEGWSELWDDLGPLLEGVRTTGVAYSAADRPFMIDRHGYLEQVNFDISYDPVVVEDGTVGGVYCIVSETTSKVVSDRRLRLTARLNVSLADALDTASVTKGFLGALSDAAPDIPFARLYLPESDVLGPTPSTTDAGDVPDDLPHPGTTDEPHDVVVDGRTVALEVPLRASSRLALGTLVLGVDPGHPLDDEYRQFLMFLAERLKIAMVNAAVFESEHRVSMTLQRALLPERMPDHPGTDLAEAYLPATIGLDVGGDWYDALPLLDGRIALAIGDVAGKGVQAGALMGQLRTALRSYLLEGHTPADALRRLNILAMHTDSIQFATALAAVLDTTYGTLVYSSAGHFAPLALPAFDGPAHYLPARTGPPIGAVPEATFVDVNWVLPEGGAVAMFTDGLIETRGEDLDTGLARAANALATTGGRARSATDLVAGLIALRPPAERRDDIAILVARRVAEAAPAAARTQP